MRKIILLALLIVFMMHASAQTTFGGNGQVGGNFRSTLDLIDPTPPMGWNTWYGMNTTISESLIKTQVDALVSTGLSGLGYTLVSIDDGWDSRVSGVLQGDATKFPSGMASLGSYIHADGMRFGLYGSTGTQTCAGYPAQYGHESADATTLAGWGVDYWKNDWCYDSSSLWGTSSANAQAAYQAMGTPLAATGRRISYLVNYPGVTFSPAWFQTVGATTVRIGNDNGGGHWWSKAQSNLTYATLHQNKGHWLDFDMLMGGTSSLSSDAESQAQFNFYAITAAPLILGQTITALASNTAEMAIFSNTEVIAVDQDTLGVMGLKATSVTCGTTTCDVWTRLLANGDYAICMINYDASNAHTVSVLWSDFGQSGTFNIRDLWMHSSVGSSSSGYSVLLPAWGSTMLRISR